MERVANREPSTSRTIVEDFTKNGGNTTLFYIYGI